MDRQVITVDIAPGSNAQQRLMVSQGDIGRPLGVRVIQNGLPLNCTGYTAHLYVLKPDHNYYECTCTISNNNLICWDTAEQETPVAGECLAEIRITSGTNDIGTACFVEYVEASPADLGYASESLISSMTEYVDAAQQAAEEAEQVVADVDNVTGVAVDSSGHIVLSKVLGSQVVSDETVPLFVDLVPETTCTTIPQAVEAVWSRFPYGRVFVGNVTVNGIKRYICGFRRLGAAGVVIGFNEDGTGVIVMNNNGTFANYAIITNTVTTSTVSKASAISGGTLDMNVCRKVGNVVTASARVWGINQTANGTFFTIPAGFRPSSDVYITGYVYITGTGAVPAPFHIYPNGNVDVVYSSSVTTTQASFSGTYAV